MFTTGTVRRSAAISFGLLSIFTMIDAARADITVPLAVTERAHVARTGELAAGGVPMPQGAVKDASGFCVVDEKDQPIPAQFDVLSRWPGDGSVRWMLVQFPVTVKSDATAKFTLKQNAGAGAGDGPARGIANPKPKDTLKVEDGADLVTVDTGAIKFTVRKKNFAVIDTVIMPGSDEKKTPVTLGPKLCGDGFVLTTTQPEQTFTMAADPDSKVTVEDVGPLRATIRADGRHKAADGTGSFAYRVRISATAGSGVVHVQYTFTHDTGPFTNTPVEVKELSLTWRPKLGFGLEQWSFGTNSGSHTGRIQIGETCRVAVLDGKNLVTKGLSGVSGPIGDTGREDLGYFSVGSGNGPHCDDFAGCVRWFRQLYPKALSIGPDLAMKIELVPADAAEPAHIYRGMAKTHDMLLTFTAGTLAINESTAFQQPLFVKCPPSWYCQDTLGMGRLASSDCKSVKADFANFTKVVDDGFDKQIDVIRNWRSTVVDPKRGTDSYGMIHFGDGFHHASGSGHKNILWDDCYYGYTHLLAMQFARTGHDTILDTLREATMCEGDVCVAWETLDIAAPRLNPSAYHIGGFGSFENGPSGSYNFYHPDGLMEAFYLTGDRRYEDAGLANYNWALQADGYDMYNNPRSVGAGLRAMVHGYLATGNKAFLYAGREIARKSERFFRVHGDFAPVSNSIFMCPNALEGLCVYHEFTGDPVLGKALPEMVAAHVRKFVKNPASLEYAYARLYIARLTGDDATRKLVEEALARDGKFSVQTKEHAVKDFASGKRGVPLIFWHLSDLADTPAGKKPWGVPAIDLGPDRPDRIEIPELIVPKIDDIVTHPPRTGAVGVDLVGTPDPTRKLAADTRLKLAYDDKNLYLVVDAAEPKMDQLKVSVKEDGGPAYNDDCVEIYVGPSSRLADIKLIVNAAGVRAVSVRGHKKDLIAKPSPADFPVVAGKNKAGWVLDVTIPWDKIGLKGATAGTEVAFNVIRFRVGGSTGKAGESSTWQGTSNQIESVGTLVLKK